MKNKQLILLLMFTPLFMNVKCKKQETPEGYFFMCKLDGKEYRASGGLCVNCISGDLLGDTLLSFNGSRSTDAIVIGIIDKRGIKQNSYILNHIVAINGNWGGGTYKNSLASNDRYDTDSIRTGQLTIARLDKIKKEVEGTFYFKAYNPVQDKIVTITDGKFRINYRE